MIMIRNVSSIVKYEKMKLQNHFYEMLTATVSHDMRTPLNAMIGLLNTMDVFVQDERGKRFLKIISSSSEILLFLVNDLLDFFQIKHNKFRKNEYRTNIKQSIGALIDIFGVAAEEKGLQLRYIVSDRVPQEVITDEQRVKQVLINLIQNALKFTMQGSITVLVDYRDDMLRVTVRDTGIGIKSEDKERLFTLFGRLEDTAQMNTTGIGLGLSICMKIVELFQGTICLDDTGEAGSSFTFTFKCQDHESHRSEFNGYITPNEFGN